MATCRSIRILFPVSDVVDVSKISANNVPFGFSFPSVCGGDFVQGKFSFRQISVSNGHFTGQAIFTAEVIDSTTGQVVDRASSGI
jgi:hypothetical protein